MKFSCTPGRIDEALHDFECAAKSIFSLRAMTVRRCGAHLLFSADG